MVQRAAEGRLGRLKGDINYGNGRVAHGTDLYMKFWAGGVSYPFKSHDTWFLAENIRWGKFAPDTDIKALVDKVNREDIWREPPRISASPRPTFRHRPRAARKPSSTARSSTRRTRPPISTAWRSRPPPDPPPARGRRAGSSQV
jgi:hypothetical protein